MSSSPASSVETADISLPPATAAKAGQAKRKTPSNKWSIHHVPQVPEETARRISDLRKSGVNPVQLKESLKHIVWNYKIAAKDHKTSHTAHYVQLSPAELARIRLSNLSYLHCADINLGVIPLFRAMSANRILAHKHDLREHPEKIELARAYARIVSAIHATLPRTEWGAKDIAVLIKKYYPHADAVIRSIKAHAAVDERLIEAEIAGIHRALQEGSI